MRFCLNFVEFFKWIALLSMLESVTGQFPRNPGFSNRGWGSPSRGLTWAGRGPFRSRGAFQPIRQQDMSSRGRRPASQGFRPFAPSGVIRGSPTVARVQSLRGLRGPLIPMTRLAPGSRRSPLARGVSQTRPSSGGLRNPRIGTSGRSSFLRNDRIQQRPLGLSPLSMSLRSSLSGQRVDRVQQRTFTGLNARQMGNIESSFSNRFGNGPAGPRGVSRVSRVRVQQRKIPKVQTVQRQPHLTPVSLASDIPANPPLKIKNLSEVVHTKTKQPLGVDGILETIKHPIAVQDKLVADKPSDAVVVVRQSTLVKLKKEDKNQGIQAIQKETIPIHMSDLQVLESNDISQSSVINVPNVIIPELTPSKTDSIANTVMENSQMQASDLVAGILFGPNALTNLTTDTAVLNPVPIVDTLSPAITNLDMNTAHMAPSIAPVSFPSEQIAQSIIPVAGGTDITAVSPQFYEDLVNEFIAILDGKTASVISTGQTSVPVQGHVHQPSVRPQFYPTMSGYPFGAYPWMQGPMNPAMMQELMFGDTTDPPDPIQTTPVPTTAPVAVPESSTVVPIDMVTGTVLASQPSVTESVPLPAYTDPTMMSADVLNVTDATVSMNAVEPTTNAPITYSAVPIIIEANTNTHHVTETATITYSAAPTMVTEANTQINHITDAAAATVSTEGTVPVPNKTKTIVKVKNKVFTDINDIINIPGEKPAEGSVRMEKVAALFHKARGKLSALSKAISDIVVARGLAPEDIPTVDQLGISFGSLDAAHVQSQTEVKDSIARAALLENVTDAIPVTIDSKTTGLANAHTTLVPPVDMALPTIPSKFFTKQPEVYQTLQTLMVHNPTVLSTVIKTDAPTPSEVNAHKTELIVKSLIDSDPSRPHHELKSVLREMSNTSEPYIESNGTMNETETTGLNYTVETLNNNSTEVIDMQQPSLANVEGGIPFKMEQIKHTPITTPTPKTDAPIEDPTGSLSILTALSSKLSQPMSPTKKDELAQKLQDPKIQALIQEMLARMLVQAKASAASNVNGIETAAKSGAKKRKAKRPTTTSAPMTTPAEEIEIEDLPMTSTVGMPTETTTAY